MNIKNFIVRQGVGAVLLLATGNLKADVTMSIIDPNAGGSGSQFCENSGLSASLNGSTIIGGGQWVGIYSFNVQSGSSPSTPFYTISLGPNGGPGDGNLTYSQLTFAQANAGQNPTAWAWNNNPSSPQFWGLQDANYLFKTFSGSIIGGNGSSLGLGGSEQDQGAALALAMYAALFNSTGYGQLGGARFNNTSSDGNVNTDYNDILSALVNYTGADLATGYVLRPADSTGQDMILSGSDLPQGGPPPPSAPEPTTLIAAAMLLLPFGASTVRIFRKRAAA